MTLASGQLVSETLWVVVVASKQGQFAFRWGDEPTWFPGFLSAVEIVRALADEVSSPPGSGDPVVDEAVLQLGDAPVGDPLERQDMDLVFERPDCRASFRAHVYCREFVHLAADPCTYVMALGGRPFKFPLHLSLVELNERLAKDQVLFQELSDGLQAIGDSKRSLSDLQAALVGAH